MFFPHLCCMLWPNYDVTLQHSLTVLNQLWVLAPVQQRHFSPHPTMGRKQFGSAGELKLPILSLFFSDKKGFGVELPFKRLWSACKPLPLERQKQQTAIWWHKILWFLNYTALISYLQYYGAVKMLFKCFLIIIVPFLKKCLYYLHWTVVWMGPASHHWICM